MHHQKPAAAWAAALLVLALFATRATAGEPASRPEEPVIGPTSWSDSLTDLSGLSRLDRAQQSGGQVNLTRLEPLGSAVHSIVALAEGPDAAFYLGTTEARLWRYDPATGTTTDLGMPVPEECDN